MPILSPIGRRSGRMRLLIGALYALLLLGAGVMVYPFLLMISGSTKSAVDIRDYDVLPRFLVNDEVLYRKHLEGLFNESLDLLNSTYDTDTLSFERVAPPPPAPALLLDEWRRFLEQAALPAYASECGYLYTPMSKTVPLNLRLFREYARGRHGSTLAAFNRALETDFVQWYSFLVLPDNFLVRRSRPGLTRLARELAAFKQTCPAWLCYYFSLEGFYKKMFLKTQYTRDLAEYNHAHRTAYTNWSQITLARAYPARGTQKQRQDWEQFVRYSLNLLWVRVAPDAGKHYHAYLQARYRSIEVLNRLYGTSHTNFDAIPLIQEPPVEGLAASDWEAFIAGWRNPEDGVLHMAPATSLYLTGVDFQFQDYLERHYGDITNFNTRAGTAYAGYDKIRPPQARAHYEDFLAQRHFLRREFATRNYRAVLDYLVVHGRGIYNTLVYCGLSVLLALLINPLAAYALSRYRPPSTFRILLFLLLTMAFPPMVTQIPVFLLLRKLGLLNTFAALLLPGLASGYSIFLLKGFFDSLPRELYECAALDGAGEWTMFWCITMRLSTPILSVIALHAFAVAYANFMFALLLCQDEKMWTLMVWLYELQQQSGPAVMYASLMLAAIPTLLVFMFSQKILLRGIVVPAEK